MPKLSFCRFVVEVIAVVIIGLYHETFNLKKTGHICFDFDLFCISGSLRPVGSCVDVSGRFYLERQAQRDR